MSVKIKIAYILTPITFGGAEKVSLNFLEKVDRERFEIVVILLLRPWEHPPYFAREINRLGYEYVSIPVAKRPGGDLFRIMRVLLALMKIFKAERFDLVHTHGYFADICAIPLTLFFKSKSISTCHGYISGDFKIKVYNHLDKIALKFCDIVIAVSEGIKNELLINGIENDKIKVMPNAVSIYSFDSRFEFLKVNKRNQLKIDKNKYVVGFIGRLSEEKGLKYLIHSIFNLHKLGLSIVLLIVGDGSEKDTLMRQVRSSGLQDNVLFVGFQTDIKNWLPAFDVFVLPSLTEGTPLSLLEAMAAGVPVVASAVGGVPDVVVDGVNGILVEHSNSMALMTAIKTLLDDKSLRFQLAKSGVETIANRFDIDPWCRSIESQYESCWFS
jgi:glycosyltransferase involved in cell wall biosynthesis